MEKGAYIVSSHPDIKYDINFSVKPNITVVSEVQQKLHLEIEKTLVVVRKLFENSETELEKYYSQILTIAQAGLVPQNAQPAISYKALQQLKEEIVNIKSGEVKNSYFKLLGVQAIKLAWIPLAIALIVKLFNYYFSIPTFNDLNVFANFSLMWTACMAGIWLSFGARKTILTFEELTTIEEDRLEPIMRLIFTGVISLVFGLLFFKQAVTINFGSVSSKDIQNDSFTAMIFGVLLGLSEQVLGKKITKKAATILDKI